jgi:hypothetical protein
VLRRARDGTGPPRRRSAPGAWGGGLLWRGHGSQGPLASGPGAGPAQGNNQSRPARGSGAARRGGGGIRGPPPGARAAPQGPRGAPRSPSRALQRLHCETSAARRTAWGPWRATGRRRGGGAAQCWQRGQQLLGGVRPHKGVAGPKQVLVNQRAVPRNNRSGGVRVRGAGAAASSVRPGPRQAGREIWAHGAPPRRQAGHAGRGTARPREGARRRRWSWGHCGAQLAAARAGPAARGAGNREAREREPRVPPAGARRRVPLDRGACVFLFLSRRARKRVLGGSHGGASIAVRACMHHEGRSASRGAVRITRGGPHHEGRSIQAWRAPRCRAAACSGAALIGPAGLKQCCGVRAHACSGMGTLVAAGARRRAGGPV